MAVYAVSITLAEQTSTILEKCDFITESSSETGYTTNTKYKEVFL